VVYCLTADKEKEESKANRNDIRPPTSVNLPPSLFTQKKDEFNKPSDNQRTPQTVPYAAGLRSGGTYASQNGSRTSPFGAGPQPHRVRTPAGTSPAVEQVTGTPSVNVGSERLPHVVDKAWTSPDVNQELEERKARAKEEDEKRLRQKEEELRILQVILFLFQVFFYKLS